MGLKVRLYKSDAGASEAVLATIRGLGLKHFGHERILKDTPEIRGMVFKVQHLVSQEVVKEEAVKRQRQKPRKIRGRDARRLKMNLAPAHRAAEEKA